MQTSLTQLAARHAGFIVFLNLPRHDTMLQLISHLALRRPLRVIAAGNRFRAFGLARHLRRHTGQVEAVLARIEVARPFTAYQALSLVTNLAAAPQPLVVLDLLAPFSDESISDAESGRLLQQVLAHLTRLSDAAPVIASVRPPPQPARAGFVARVQAAADVLYHPDEPAAPTPLSLF